jgi:hypothetical protein
MQVKTILLAACTLAGLAAAAHADAFECKSTETQAECHDRLKCKANEELEDCQKRLRAAGGQTNGNSNDDRDGRDRAAGDRNRDSDRGDNGRGNDRDDNRRGDNGRGDDDRGGRDRDDGGSSERRGRRRGGGGSHSSFVANKTFGLGLELGEPDGLNGKYFVRPSQALDFGVGYIYDHYYYGDGLHLYADYLWHFSVASTPSFELPFYIGPGLRFWQFDYCVQNVCGYGGSAVGIRMPIGIAFDFNNSPIDIFLQLVPTLDFLSGDYYTRTQNREHFGMDGSVGIRVWFN